MEGKLEITFEVSKKSIMDKIRTNSFYRGERIKDVNGTHAARMQAGVDNDDVLQDELALAATDVVTMITRNLGRCVLNEVDNAAEGEESDNITNVFYSFEVQGATNFPVKLKKGVEDSIGAYMFDKALEGWMLINMPDEVQALGQRSVADAEKLKMILVEREKPVR